jgi:hypothetical protein
VNRATSVSLPGLELRRRAIFGALWRFNVLGRCVFLSLPPVLRRLIASPEAQDKAS